MRVQEIGEIDYLEHHLRNLKVVQNEVVLHHLVKSAMVVVEDQTVRVPLYLLLETHVRRHLSHRATIFYRNPIETDQVSAVVGLELLQVQKKRFHLTHG
jgi:hypothetical protein